MDSLIWSDLVWSGLPQDRDRDRDRDRGRGRGRCLRIAKQLLRIATQLLRILILAASLYVSHAIFHTSNHMNCL